MTSATTSTLRRLHLGCGRDIRPGWTNLDRVAGPGVDVVRDLDACEHTPLPFEDDSFDEIHASHVLEHLAHPLPFMQELHRVAAPGARVVFTVPYGSSDDASTDPTHQRRYFKGSWGFFSQPYYWRADYGYRGDWQPQYVLLDVDAERAARARANDDASLHTLVDAERNVVLEMTAVLTAVKPIRPADKTLQVQPVVEFRLIRLAPRAGGQ